MQPILMEKEIKDCSIVDIVDFRSLNQSKTNQFYFLSEIPSIFEPYPINPNYYSFGLITEGSLTIKIDNKVCDLTKNTLMVYRPKEIFRLVAIAPKTKGAFILFTKEFVNKLAENIFTLKNKSFLSYGAKFFFNLNEADRDSLLSVFNTIFLLLNKPMGPQWKSMARNLTSALIFQTEFILKKYIDVERIHINKNEMIFRLFRNEVMRNFTKERNLKFYAEKLNINSNQLGVIVKRVSGKSPRKIINSLLINEAKRLLKTTNDTVGIIAYSLNYADIYTFSKFFKKNTGFSPSEFRTMEY